MTEQDDDPRPTPPVEPHPAECCGKGCDPCVFDHDMATRSPPLCREGAAKSVGAGTACGIDGTREPRLGMEGASPTVARAPGHALSIPRARHRRRHLGNPHSIRQCALRAGRSGAVGRVAGGGDRHGAGAVRRRPRRRAARCAQHRRAVRRVAWAYRSAFALEYPGFAALLAAMLVFGASMSLFDVAINTEGLGARKPRRPPRS